jgi:hypothetical protein
MAITQCEAKGVVLILIIARRDKAAAYLGTLLYLWKGTLIGYLCASC